MTASGVQPKIGSGRRIIERPRLIKLLDETDARTILLLAPAGYGKTTLARQWLKGMSRCITLSLTPSDRDVIWLAEEIARELEPLDAAATRLVREHILARPSADRAPAVLGRALSEAVESAGVRWVFLDNYESIISSPESEALVAHLEASPRTQLFVASRVRPRWASGRNSLYGEVCEVTRADLAMTEEEVTKVVGRNAKAARIADQACGWAAAIGLAATLEASVALPTKLPTHLHRYLAEELFARVPASSRDDLFSLALLGSTTQDGRSRGDSVSPRLAELDALGFGTGVEPFELHPLIEDFLLEKLLEEVDAAKRVRDAIEMCLAESRWERALALVMRFGVKDMVDRSLRAAFKPLIRTGRLTSLSAVANWATERGDEAPLAATELVQSEVALGSGQIEFAQQLAESAEAHMTPADPLSSRAAAIRGQCLHFKAELSAANTAFEVAYERAQDERDRAEALNGITFTTIFNEQLNAPEVLSILRERRNDSSTAFLRYWTADIAYRVLGGPGLGSPPLPLDAIQRAWVNCEDPRARSSVAHTVSYQLAVAAEYEAADGWIQLFLEDARRFGLEFAVPLATWVIGRIALGRRRFAEVERALQAIENEAVRTRDHQHKMNAATLRARLLLQGGDIASALAHLNVDLDQPLIPSWRGELLATRALALALAGDRRRAYTTADAALAATLSHDAHVFAQVARAAIDPAEPAARRRLIDSARKLNVWDPVLCGARASADLAQALCEDEQTRPSMEFLYQVAQDLPLARRAGFRTRATGTPTALLTPRELEVLGLIASGCRNRDISRTLFISDSTTKVHVRHIFEKLGVRSRAEAAARYEQGMAESATRSRHEAGSTDPPDEAHQV